MGANGENNYGLVNKRTGLIDDNTYYKSSDIIIFPSSNAVDDGKLFTELNGRNITIDITDINYVVGPNPGGYDISNNASKNMIDIQPGKAIINGFEVLTKKVISYRYPTVDELYKGDKYKHKYGGKNSFDEESDAYALLCLHTIFDSLENISGNVQVGEDWYCEGIHVCYASAEQYEAHENEYLLLGGVTTDGKVRINNEKFDRINADKILVRLEPDSETGAPPKQSTDLLTFINNYLHGYWVSKAGDHEYGNLTFRKKPNKYLNTLFGYESEEPLNNEIYAIKLGRVGIDDASDSNPAYQKGYINLKYCDDSSFSGYEKQISIRPLGSFYKDNLKDNGNDILDNTNVNYNVYVGYIRGLSSGRPDYDISGINSNSEIAYNNTFVSRITNKASNKTDILGDICLSKANVNGVGTFIWDSYGFNSGTNFKIQFYNNSIYVGTTDRSNQIQNDLFSVNKSIRTAIHQEIDSRHFSIDISAQPNKQQIAFKTYRQNCYIKLRSDSNIANNTKWINVMNMGPSVEIDKDLWTKGYVVVGTTKDHEETDETGSNNRIVSSNIGTDPSQIKVPDLAHGGERNIQPGDIYAKQVWCSVYNDITEMFNVPKHLINKNSIGLILAQNNDKLNEYTIADRKNNNIVGIISENPGICLGTANGGVPVALAGRVKVRYEGPKIKPGDFVGLSKKTPGYATKCWHFSKYRCGKMLRKLDDNFVEILVLL